MHPISFEMQFKQRSAELQQEAEKRRRIKELPKQPKQPKTRLVGKKATRVATVGSPKRV